jgi:hypothetical protein
VLGDQNPRKADFFGRALIRNGGSMNQQPESAAIDTVLAAVTEVNVLTESRSDVSTQVEPQGKSVETAQMNDRIRQLEVGSAAHPQEGRK